MPSKPSSKKSPSSSRSWIVPATLVASGLLVALIVFARGKDMSAGPRADRGVGEASGSSAATAGTRVASAGGEADHAGARDAQGSGAALGEGPSGDRQERNGWKPGERREAWERKFGDGTALGDHETLGDDQFTSHGGAGSSKHHLRKRRHGGGPEGGGDAAVAGVPEALNKVFESEPDTQYDTQSQIDAGKLKNFTGGSGTISFWVQPTWGGGSQDDASFVQIGDDALGARVYKNVNFLRFEIAGPDGQTASVGMPIDQWSNSDPHRITTTWDGTTHQMSLFDNDKLISQNAYNLQLKMPSDPKLSVGSDWPLTRPVAPATVSGLQVRTDALDPYAVAHLFHSIQPPQMKQ